MTKILFSADWHIKLRSNKIPKDWQINRYRLLFKELWSLQSEYDLHIIGGDIFDTVPSLEELNLFIEYISRVSKPVFIYDGNHEATRKRHTFFEYLKDIFELVNENVAVILGPFSDYEYDIIPYTHIKSKDLLEYKNNNILFTHVRGAIPPHVKPEIDLDKLAPWDIVFAGDLHSHSNTQLNIVYPGSPLTTSFHRTRVDTGVILLDTNNPRDYSFIKFNPALPQLIRKKIKSEDEIIQSSYDYYRFELEGDFEDIAKVSSDIIDKKIINNKNDTSTLNFSTHSSMLEEISDYLKTIVGVNEVDKYLEVLHDTIPEIRMG